MIHPWDYINSLIGIKEESDFNIARDDESLVWCFRKMGAWYQERCDLQVELWKGLVGRIKMRLRIENAEVRDGTNWTIKLKAVHLTIVAFVKHMSNPWQQNMGLIMYLLTCTTYNFFIAVCPKLMFIVRHLFVKAFQLHGKRSSLYRCWINNMCYTICMQSMLIWLIIIDKTILHLDKQMLMHHFKHSLITVII